MFLEIGGVLFDAVGPYAPFVFTGLSNVVIVCYALWVMMGAGAAQQSARVSDGGETSQNGM